MKQIVKLTPLIAGLSYLDNISQAIETVTIRVKGLADTLESIDNNLEVEEDEKLYL